MPTAYSRLEPCCKTSKSLISSCGLGAGLRVFHSFEGEPRSRVPHQEHSDVVHFTAKDRLYKLSDILRFVWSLRSCFDRFPTGIKRLVMLLLLVKTGSMSAVVGMTGNNMDFSHRSLP